MRRTAAQNFKIVPQMRKKCRLYKVYIYIDINAYIRTFVHKEKALPIDGRASVSLAEAVGFEPTWPVKAKQFSRLPRYDRFDKPPYLKALKYT